MSKQTEMSLLVPGAEGWEIWKQETEGGFVRTLEGGPVRVGDLEKLPGGDLALLFPVKSIHALPFKAPSGDESLFQDLAVLHAERLGIRPDPMAGQLSDSFVVASDEESATLLHVVLRSPGDGELPARTPKEFDISPRAFPVAGDAVAAWKELGRWVFAVFQDGKLLYSQATSADGAEPDSDFLREIHLALGQLAIQGLRVKPQSVHVWTPNGELGGAGSLADGLGVPAQIALRPDPVLPGPRSRLLPADVRAARRERAKRNQVIALGAAAALVYLGFVGWMLFGLWQETQQRNRLANQAAAVAGESMAFQQHQAEWSELGPVADSKRNPVEIMYQVANAIPRNSQLRLKTTDISPGEVKILGSAPQSTPVTTFDLALKRNSDLSWLEWNNANPSNTSKGWDFVFTATEKP